MIKALLAFFTLWIIVFCGISIFWHTPMTRKIDMMKVGLYSFMTAFITFALLTIIVVLF
jgi:hypothetical protein